MYKLTYLRFLLRFKMKCIKMKFQSVINLAEGLLRNSSLFKYLLSLKTEICLSNTLTQLFIKIQNLTQYIFKSYSHVHDARARQNVTCRLKYQLFQT